MPTDVPELLELSSAILRIVLIDIVLAGDNAVVIALAARTLQGRRRRAAIALGASFAVVLRIALTFVASQLLTMPFLKIVGGALVLWIAVKLLITDSSAHPDERARAAGIWQAMWMILVADASMSVDNILAVAAAAQGSNYLLFFGLALSIPLVVFASSLLARLMDRYVIIVYLGAAVLGHVGGEMLVTDHALQRWIQPTELMGHAVGLVCAGLVLLIAYRVRRRRRKIATRAL